MLKISYIGQQNQTNGFIKDLLESEYDASIEFLDPRTVLEDASLLHNTSTDLVIYDLNTSSGLGKATHNIALISRSIEDCPLLILHHYDNEKFIRPLIEAGAEGAIPLAPSEQELSEAVEQVLNGKTYPSHMENNG